MIGRTSPSFRRRKKRLSGSSWKVILSWNEDTYSLISRFIFEGRNCQEFILLPRRTEVTNVDQQHGRRRHRRSSRRITSRRGRRGSRRGSATLLPRAAGVAGDSQGRKGRDWIIHDYAGAFHHPRCMGKFKRTSRRTQYDKRRKVHLVARDSSAGLVRF